MFWLMKLPFRVAFLPVTVLWLGYRALWWTIDGQPATKAFPKDAEGLALARQLRTTPIWALRSAFAGTLLGSGLAAVACAFAVDERAVAPDHATLIWGWSTLVMATVGLVLVRITNKPRVMMRDRMRAAAERLKHGPKQAAHRGAAAFRTMADGVKRGYEQAGPAEAVGAQSVSQPPVVDAAPQAQQPQRNDAASEPCASRFAKVSENVGRKGRCCVRGARCAGTTLLGAMGRGMERVGRSMSNVGAAKPPANA